MKMMNDWIRIRQLERKSEVAIVDALGNQVQTQGATDEDTLFQVLELGPDVKEVKIGNVVVVSFNSGMYRFKLPTDAFSSFAVRESDVLGIVSKQP